MGGPGEIRLFVRGSRDVSGKADGRLHLDIALYTYNMDEHLLLFFLLSFKYTHKRIPLLAYGLNWRGRLLQYDRFHHTTPDIEDVHIISIAS